MRSALPFGLIGLVSLPLGLLLSGCETAPSGPGGPGGEYGTVGTAGPAEDAGYGGSAYGAPPGEIYSPRYGNPGELGSDRDLRTEDRTRNLGTPEHPGASGPSGEQGIQGPPNDLEDEGGASGTGSELDRGAYGPAPAPRYAPAAPGTSGPSGAPGSQGPVGVAGASRGARHDLATEGGASGTGSELDTGAYGRVTKPPPTPATPETPGTPGAAGPGGEQGKQGPAGATGENPPKRHDLGSEGGAAGTGSELNSD